MMKGLVLARTSSGVLALHARPKQNDNAVVVEAARPRRPVLLLVRDEGPKLLARAASDGPSRP